MIFVVLSRGINSWAGERKQYPREDEYERQKAGENKSGT
jgi:hypothetical protein